jgi:hypothetical protein
VFSGLSAFDPDSNVNGQVEFRVVEDDDGDNAIDGGGSRLGSHFAINLPHQGLVRLVRPLDYETRKVHHVTIEARVRKKQRARCTYWTHMLTLSKRVLSLGNF